MKIHLANRTFYCRKKNGSLHKVMAGTKEVLKLYSAIGAPDMCLECGKEFFKDLEELLKEYNIKKLAGI